MENFIVEKKGISSKKLHYAILSSPFLFLWFFICIKNLKLISAFYNHHLGIGQAGYVMGVGIPWREEIFG